jgi:LuxR family maltose regulon positive regulatory protein
MLMQPYPLLHTKLHIPAVRPGLVSRSRLIERLNSGLDRKLTVISAPAGFGKTTLVSEWLANLRLAAAKEGQITEGIAWLSLDESDNDLIRFLVYLVAALQTIEANIGKGVMSALQTPQPPPIEAVLTSLINEIAALPGRIALVLDDYHLIEAQPTHEALAFLLDHLPPQMHLVIATREDPPLPLARLRARGQLTELRFTDLRFMPSEAAEFFNQVMGLNLSPEQIASLENRTEGWVAGLQLAALSMCGREDVSGFISAFAGDNRYIVDYLVEEVLQRQSEAVRRFLLQTSILDRLSGPLCDAVCSSRAETAVSDRAAIADRSEGTAVTGREDGGAMLEALERGNLFVVPLDDKRQWYRYHQLFADVLQVHFREQQPHQVPTLHRRASDWYEQNGLRSDAIRHALAADDFERAAGLVELAWPAMDRSFQSATWLGWVKALPDELVRARPVLSAGYAWALLNSGEMEAAEARLRDAERWLDAMADPGKRPEAPPTGMVVLDEVQFRALPASIATARAYRALALADVAGTVKYARRALDFLPEEEHQWRGAATSLLGLAQYASGDLLAAERSFADFLANMRKSGKILEAISITFLLADIRLALGRLREAVSAYQQSLQLAASQGEPMPLGTADLYRGLAELHCERGDLQAAAEHLLASERLGEQAALTDWQHRLCVAQARLRETQGDLDGALDLLDEAERVHIRSPLPDVRPIAALKTRLWVRQGRLVEARAWAREQALSDNDDLSYLREFEHITLARLLIARYKSDGLDCAIHKAVELLARLLQAAQEGGRMGSAIEILVLQALAHQAQGDIPHALAPLERALALAEPEGYVRIFVDEGPPMADLLREAAKHCAVPNYFSQLRAAFGQAERTTPVTQPILEPLTERELEVLRLLRTELSGPEIARELVVSLNTMRTHTKNIYSKLGVNSRRSAVRRAEELGLL